MKHVLMHTNVISIYVRKLGDALIYSFSTAFPDSGAFLYFLYTAEQHITLY